MPASKIKCGGCGTLGDVEIYESESSVTPDLLFKYLGYHEFTGNMYFLCPHCSREVVVNPMEFLETQELITARAYLPAFASTEIIRAGRVSLKTLVIK